MFDSYSKRINLMPLEEPVPVWTPFDCCLILIQKETNKRRKKGKKIGRCRVVIQMKSKRARSIYGTLSVCGFVTNFMPLEPVPVWTPFDCCLLKKKKVCCPTRVVRTWNVIHNLMVFCSRDTTQTVIGRGCLLNNDNNLNSKWVNADRPHHYNLLREPDELQKKKYM